jgi:hypothetical protein
VSRVLVLMFAAALLASCSSKGSIGDYIPEWLGGPAKNSPPRPGTPEYDTYRRQLDAEAARDKSKDAPDKTGYTVGGCPQR